MKRKSLIIAIITIILMLAGIIFGITYTKEDVDKISEGVEAVIKIIEENKSTTEIPELTITDEEALEYQETEDEGFQLQGEIAYNGSTEIPNIEVGEYAGLTYYSQIDKRWKDILYTSTKNETQTIGSSGCGPTCGAMVVSSIKGNIDPQEMANLYIKYGFRSANNGTYWSAFRWTADVFDIEYTEKYKLNDVVELLQNKYMAIVACGNGLFTTGGHFILIYGIEGNTLKIYDPYLYQGKFETSTRKGKVTVEGNTINCSIENFREYANYSGFFCFKNDRTDINENTTTIQTVQKENDTQEFTSYKVKVTAKIGLNARIGAGTRYAKKTAYTYGKILTIVAESNGWGKTSDGYWVCLQYTSKSDTNIKNTVGQYKKFKTTYTYIYSNSDLTGEKYTYLANTTVKILENVSTNVDKIYVPATGRYGYVNTNVYK